MLDFDFIEWDDEDDPRGNVQHIAAAGLTPEEVEDVLRSPDVDHATSDSTGRPAVFGETRSGKYIIVVYDQNDDGGVVVITPRTAYEVDPARVMRRDDSMNFGTERNRKAWEKLTSEQQAAYLAGRERRKAERETPEYQAQLAADIAAIQRECPPARPDAELVEALAALRLERERQGLSLTDVSERSGIDRATISKLETGKIANPTVGTLRAYAKALGRRLAWTLAE